MKALSIRKLLSLLVMGLACSFSAYGQGDSLELTELASIDLNPASALTALPDQQGRDYLYVAAREGGLFIFDISNRESPQLIDTIPNYELDYLQVMNVSQNGNYLYLALGNFFDAGSEPASLAIVNVANPLQPVVEDQWLADSAIKGSGIVVSDGDYAYLGAMSQGLIILDVRNKGDIKLSAKLRPDPFWPKSNPTTAQIPNARGMALRNDTIFLCYDAGGLRIIDVSDKQQPVEVGRYVNPIMENKPLAYNNIVLRGKYAYAAVDYCGMEILDISDASNITEVAWWNPWECHTNPLNWFTSRGHTNQVELWNDHAFLSAGDAELMVVDISNPAQPDSIGEFGQPKNLRGAWGASVQGQYAYVAYIKTLGIPFASNFGGIKIVKWDDGSVGIRSGKKDKMNISAAPNPFTQRMIIKLDNFKNLRGELVIVNLTGEEVLHLKGLWSSEWQWNGLDNAGKPVPSGVYLCKVVVGEQQWVLKLLKN